MAKWLTTSVVLLASMLASPAQAAPRAGANDPTGTEQHIERPDPSPKRSLHEAAERVRTQTGGRILSATTEHEGGRLVHRIKVLTPDSRVRVFHIDQ